MAVREKPPRSTVPGRATAPRRAGTVALLVLLPALLVAGGAVSAYPRSAPPRDVDWNAGFHPRPERHRLAIGVTHTQYSIDPWGDAAAQGRARSILATTASYQNQHIFGWGGLNPEPSPGVYDWSALDRRMELIRSSGGIPVITLCCAPDWMKGGRPGETNWDRLEAAPLPEHYRDFAALAATVARRYPQVRHFQVWNELKGFWSNAKNRWDYEAYTRLYNEVYDALKAVNRDLKVGGPYVVFETWHDPDAGGHASSLAGACGVVDQRSLDVLEYWLEHKHGADFVAVDASLSTRDHGLATPTATAVQVFDALTRWIRQRTSLPVWWSEFHIGGGEGGQHTWRTAAAVATLLRMAAAGASVALIWQPQNEHGGREPGAPRLWSSTEQPGGGTPLPYATAVAHAQFVLADGASPGWVSWPSPEVGILWGRRTVLLVHLGDGDVTVEVDGQPLRLGPHEVRYLVVPPRPLGTRARTALRRVADTLVPRPPETSGCLRLTRNPVPRAAAGAAPTTPTGRPM